MNRTLLLHFLKLDISSSTLDFGPWLDALYTSNDLRTEFPGPHPTLTMQLEDAETTGVRVNLPADGVFAETNLCSARCYYESGRFYSSKGGSAGHEIAYDMHEHTIRGILGGEYLHTPQLVLGNIIRPILQSFILPFYGIKTLHGAVLAKGDRTLFLAGPGGAGKTTTATQLMLDGYDLLSDDGPFFVLRDGQAHALASLDYMHLHRDTTAMFPQIEGHVVGKPDAREKFAVRMQDLQSGNSWKYPRAVTHYISLRRSDVARPRLRRYSKATAHRQLVHHSMIVFRHPQFRNHYEKIRAYSAFISEVLASVIQHAEVYEMEFANGHLSELPEVLKEL